MESDGNDIGMATARYQDFFLALTLVIMVIIIIISRDISTALLLMGILTNYLVISAQLTMMKKRKMQAMTGKHKHTLGGFGADRLTETGFEPREKFISETAAIPSVPIHDQFEHTVLVQPPYEGAIEVSDTDDPFLSYLGHTEKSHHEVAPVGNPYNMNSAKEYVSAPLCMRPDEAVDVLDADEKLAIRARSRSDVYKESAGIQRRKALIARMVSEEVKANEKRDWWTANEY